MVMHDTAQSPLAEQAQSNEAAENVEPTAVKMRARDVSVFYGDKQAINGGRHRCLSGICNRLYRSVGLRQIHIPARAQPHE